MWSAHSPRGLLPRPGARLTFTLLQNLHEVSGHGLEKNYYSGPPKSNITFTQFCHYSLFSFFSFFLSHHAMPEITGQYHTIEYNNMIMTSGLREHLHWDHLQHREMLRVSEAGGVAIV